MAYGAYKFFTFVIFLFAYPLLRLYSILPCRHSQSMAERLGVFPKRPAQKRNSRPLVWMHAVSVGEAGSAIAIIKSLKKESPETSFILSTATFYGHQFAKERINSQAACIYAPIDFPFSVKSALNAFKPNALVCLETEIWPNFLVAAKRMGIRTAIVNGRISSRSVKRYLKIRPLVKEALRHVDAFSMIREEDSKRIKKMLTGLNQGCINIFCQHGSIC